MRCRFAGTDCEFHLINFEVHIFPAQVILTRRHARLSQCISALKERVKLDDRLLRRGGPQSPKK
jgi:hypothetical protein